MNTFLRDINTISRSTNLFRDQAFRQYGLTGHQVKYLFAVCGAEGVSQDELAKKLYVNKSNVARQMAALEEGGFVRREQSNDDKRVYKIYPTNKARELMPIIRAANEEWKTILLGGLSAEEAEQLSELLGAVVQNVRGYWGQL